MVMTHGIHLGDEVEIVTDEFAASGAPRGMIGVVVDEWADGSSDVEVTDPQGAVVVRFRATDEEIRPYLGSAAVREPRRHGILFGRGEELAPDVEEPPMPDRRGGLRIVGYSPAPVAFSEPPKEEIELTGDIPWELQDEPPTGPTFH